MDLLALDTQAETYISQLSSPRLQQQLVIKISAAKADQNPQEALQWISRYADSLFYSTSVQHIFSRWAYSNPADATDALTSLDIDFDAYYADAIISNIGSRRINSPQ